MFSDTGNGIKPGLPFSSKFEQASQSLRHWQERDKKSQLHAPFDMKRIIQQKSGCDRPTIYMRT